MTSWAGWKAREEAVVVFCRRGDDLLLIHKKRGLGTGKVNGPGGRLEAGETFDQAAIRECQEETGLTPGPLRAAAELWFQFTDGYSLRTRIFLADGAEGVLTPCDEADPFWHPADRLPWTQMWADDALWLPGVLADRLVAGRFVFEGDRMLAAEVRTRDRPPGTLAVDNRSLWTIIDSEVLS